MLCIHSALFPVSSLWKFSRLARGMKTILIEALMTDKPQNGPRWKRLLCGLRSLTIMKRKLRLGKGKDFITRRMVLSSVADPNLGKLELPPLSQGSLGKLLARPILKRHASGMRCLSLPSQQNPKTKTPLLKQEESSSVEAET